ncbi:MAG: hypothetical protein R3C58_15705 [Parvularculaceae bacterium]
MLADPIFQELSVGREDVRDLLSANPAMGEAVARYTAYRAAQNAAMEARAPGAARPPTRWRRRAFHFRARNYFDEPDRAGEEIAASLAADRKGRLDVRRARGAVRGAAWFVRTRSSC